MVAALRTHWLTLVLLLNALLVALAIGGILCATLICR